MRAASEKGAPPSASTGIPIVSKQHRVTRALAMEASLEVVGQLSYVKLAFRRQSVRARDSFPLLPALSPSKYRTIRTSFSCNAVSKYRRSARFRFSQCGVDSPRATTSMKTHEHGDRTHAPNHK